MRSRSCILNDHHASPGKVATVPICIAILSKRIEDVRMLGAKLVALRHLLQCNALSSTASARLQTACRALAGPCCHHGDIHYMRSSDAVGHAAALQLPRSKHAAASHVLAHHAVVSSHMTGSNQHAASRGDRWPKQLQHGRWQQRGPPANAMPWNAGIANALKRITMHAYSAAIGSDKAQQSEAAQAAAAAAARIAAAEGAAEQPLPTESRPQDAGDAVPSVGDGSAAAAAESGQQTEAGEASAAAETAELDAMLQQMMDEAEDMVLGGHPQEAIQNLTEGVHCSSFGQLHVAVLRTCQLGISECPAIRLRPKPLPN